MTLLLALTCWFSSVVVGWRRQEAFADHSRRFDFVIPETVLRWSPAGANVLIAELERLAAAVG
jgi:hypothetical protein